MLLGAIVEAGFGIGRAIPYVLGWKLKKAPPTDAFMQIVLGSSAAIRVTTGLLLSMAGGLLLVVWLGKG